MLYSLHQRLHTVLTGWMFGEMDLSLLSPGDWGDLQGNWVIFRVVIDIGSTVRESPNDVWLQEVVVNEDELLS